MDYDMDIDTTNQLIVKREHEEKQGTRAIIIVHVALIFLVLLSTVGPKREASLKPDIGKLLDSLNLEEID